MDIIIATANNVSEKNGSIYYTIRSILAQELQASNIIVSVNEPNDEVVGFIQKHFGKMVHVVDSSDHPKNISYARNNGFKYGVNRIVVFLDDDVVLARNDFLSMVNHRLKYEGFYCGAHRYWVNPGWHNYLDHSYSINHLRHILKSKAFLPKSIDRATGSQGFHNYSFIGHCGAIQRQVFEEVGMFDEAYQGWSFQDTDLMMRLCYEGYSYELMAQDDISLYHLSHPVDKSKNRAINAERLKDKATSLGIDFHLNHFFGLYNDDTYDIISHH